MNPDIKKKWQAALRSGKYLQGKGELKKRVGKKTYHCCLGVLCEIHRKETGCVWQKGQKGFLYSGRDTKVLPHAVMEWAGLAENDPWVKKNGSSRHISDLNDSGTKFPTISKLIDQL